MLLSTLGRLIWVPIAFAISAAGTVFFLVMIARERVVEAMAGRGPDTVSLGAVIDLLRQGQVLLSGLTILPALAVVVIGEVGRIRSSLYYIIGGGLAFAAVPLLARYGQSPAGAPLSTIVPPTLVWQVFATAGFLGGWVYWFLAGRNA
jgi:hypothetical protein